MMTRQRAHRLARGGRLASNAGITLVELVIVGLIGSIVLIAAFSMYLTSMETWDASGARLALQRNGDRAVKRIASDIRHGDTVEAGADSISSIVVTRTIFGATVIQATYDLVGDEVVNQHGTVLAGNVTDLEFSRNGAKVWISMTLVDDMGTTALPFDDQRIEINSLAVCRNEPS